ncbi:Uncharacterised protein [Mycobacterium tuberculosis]|uniref:Uncharacterized protein n=2 Tax=Mycobacterium tuberculosis TaxID=1773 RepID=A0A655IE10_MYCTX|nr:Uncharacterised protein [Mycobacterium tuberculosis]
MHAGHCDFGLVGPAPDIVTDAAGDDRAGLGVDEQFRHVGFLEPAPVLVDQRDDLGGLTVDWKVSWPRQRGATVLAAVHEWPPIVVHFLVAELSQDRPGQHPFDKDVVLQRHWLALRRSETLEHTPHGRRPVRPRHRGDDRFHERDPLHSVAMLVSPVEAERRAPVVQHQYHVVAEVERIPEREQKVSLLAIAIAVGSRWAELVRRAHPDQIAGHQPAQPFQVRHDVAPQVRRRGVAVLKDDGVTLAFVDIRHALPGDF